MALTMTGLVKVPAKLLLDSKMRLDKTQNQPSLVNNIVPTAIDFLSANRGSGPARSGRCPLQLQSSLFTPNDALTYMKKTKQKMLFTMNRSVICQQLRKRLSIITLATFLASLTFLFFTYLDPEARAVRGIARLGRPASRPTETSSMFGDVIEALYKPQIHPITAENFTDETGQVFRNSGEPFYKKGLGKRVLILDADTRPMNKDGELLSSGGMKWPHPDPISSGMLSHYLYCMCRSAVFIFSPVSQTAVTLFKNFP